jgi:hypothetical protein
MPIRSFSAHCAFLGFPLRNIRWSWCATDASKTRVLFTIWEDELIHGRYVLFPTSERRPREIDDEANRRLGAREIERLARFSIENPSVKAFGIVCIAKDTTAKTRRRKTFVEDMLVPLTVTEENAILVAYGTERVPNNVALGRGQIEA